MASARRALREELGVQNSNIIENLGIQSETQTSPSYPGLTTEYIRHEMHTNLPEQAFNPDGYVENQPDKNTYFVWKKL